MVSDLKAETAEAVAAEIVADGGEAVGLACDVTRESDLEAVVKTALDRFVKLSILVNYAGGSGPRPFDMPMDTFRWAYELNVFSLFQLTQLAAPHMPPKRRLQKTWRAPRKIALTPVLRYRRCDERWRLKQANGGQHRAAARIETPSEGGP